MKTLRVLAACGFLCTQFASEPAQAATYVVPGAVCRSESGTKGEDLKWWVHGQLENLGNVVPVHCPLTRHNGAAHLTGNLYVKVYNKDANPPVNIYVFATRERDTSGDFMFASGTAQGYNNVSFDTAELSLYAYGKYTVRVDLSTEDRVDSIRYSEP